MTKLMEWLLFSTIFLGIWFSAITGNIKFPITAEWQQIIVFLPLIVLFLFGLYAAVTVLYRVFTFNNCENAAIELQQVSMKINEAYCMKLLVLKFCLLKCCTYFFQQIEEAKKDLQSKGINLKSKIT